MTQATDKTKSQGNWKPRRYARIFVADMEEITEAAEGGVFGTKYFAVWCKLCFSGYNSHGNFFQESLYAISKPTGLDKKTIRKAIHFLELNKFIEVKKGGKTSAGLNESSHFRLLRNIFPKAEKNKSKGTRPEGNNSENIPTEPEGNNEPLHDAENSPVFTTTTKEGGLQSQPPNSLDGRSKKPTSKRRDFFSASAGIFKNPASEKSAVSGAGNGGVEGE